MPKMTLLDMVQNILSDMDSDEVNSYDDTTESLQVANIIKETFYFLTDNKQIPELEGLLQLTALGDTNTPTHMKIPDAYHQIAWLKYDSTPSGGDAPQFKEVVWLPSKAFLDIINQRDSGDSNIDTVTDIGSSVTLLIRNDHPPTYYTSFDDEYVVFDSYDSTVESSVQASKTMAYGKGEPTWTMDNTFVPDIDSNLFTLLLNEAKSQAFITLKQVSNSKSEQRYRKQLTKMQNDKFRTSERIDPSGRLPNYGRN